MGNLLPATSAIFISFLTVHKKSSNPGTEYAEDEIICRLALLWSQRNDEFNGHFEHDEAETRPCSLLHHICNSRADSQGESCMSHCSLGPDVSWRIMSLTAGGHTGREKTDPRATTHSIINLLLWEKPLLAQLFK
jgi:hypothetical protein